MKTLKLLGAGLLTAVMGSAHAVGSLVNVTVYDRSQGWEVPVYYHQGRHYVVGNPGSEYQVVLYNRSGARVLTVVSVDGVNAVSGETAAPDQTGYVLSPWMRTGIKGWRKSSERVAAFYFTQLPGDREEPAALRHDQAAGCPAGSEMTERHTNDLPESVGLIRAYRALPDEEPGPPSSSPDTVTDQAHPNR